MADSKKVAFAYTVVRNEDGSVDVRDAGLEGVEAIENARIYEDIEAVARLIELKRQSDASFVAAYNGIAKFYQDLAAQQQKAPTPEVTNEVKKI
jgi:hypothetical protein